MGRGRGGTGSRPAAGPSSCTSPRKGARDAADGLQNPTSVALHGNDVYVLSAACTTATDPNLLRAHLRDRR
ncbi:hypothetical protein [Streptomyces clavifer]|uniref:hypothetical protein n=1 Tax=Streptomyces clavifer TaxID=68188 RepID=UPI00365B8693